MPHVQIIQDHNVNEITKHVTATELALLYQVWDRASIKVLPADPGCEHCATEPEEAPPSAVHLPGQETLVTDAEMEVQTEQQMLAAAGQELAKEEEIAKIEGEGIAGSDEK